MPRVSKALSQVECYALTDVRASALLQKSLSYFGRWHHAFVPSAEQPIPVFGKRSVKKIAYRERHDSKCVYPRPYAVQLSGDPQRPGRMCVCPFVFYYDNRIGVGFINSVLCRKFFTDLRLQRREFEITGLVVRDNEIYRTVTKIAYTVKQDNRTHIKILPQFSDRF